MSTGAEYLNATRKRLLGREDLDDRLLSHLRTLVQESFERSFQTGVVFDAALGLAADGNDKFQITGASKSTDGLGHLLDHRDRAEYYDDIQFENTSAIDYDVALHYEIVPAGVQINPRTGIPEFIGLEEIIGESSEPDSATDNGNGTITFRVDSVAEPSVSHAGRKCLVFMKTIASGATTEAIAVETLTVAWVGGQNLITTTGVLGQTTISTTASDYVVTLLGPTVRRNTSLLDVDGYVFLGQVTGVGAGSPPSAFDTSGQDVATGSLADLHDTTSRNATTDRLKVDVKSYSGDVDDPQIAVRNPAGSVVFKVDGNGNVTVEGTTTQQDVVTVYSSETVTDNLTAGDATGDSHKIKGTWWHTDPGETANYFKVDGASGRIGIKQVPDAVYQLGISGNVRHLGIYRVESTLPSYEFRDTDGAVESGYLWRTMANGADWFIQENTAVGGDFSAVRSWARFRNTDDRIDFDAGLSPVTDDTWDLGTSDLEWQTLWIDGTAYIDVLSLSGSPEEGVGSHLYPTTDDTWDLGVNAGRAYRAIYSHEICVDDALNRGVCSNLVPKTHNSYDLGSAVRSWANFYVINLLVGADILPSTDNAYRLGNPSYRWAEGYFGGGSAAGAAGLTTSGGPSSGPGIKATGGSPDGIAVDGTGTGTGAGLYGKASGASNSSVGVHGVGDISGAATESIGVLGEGAGDGAGIQGIGTIGYGMVAESDSTSPTRAAARLVPQDTDPTTGLLGDIFPTTNGTFRTCIDATKPGWASLATAYNLINLQISNWQTQTSQFDADAIFAVTYGDDIFVAVGDNGKLSSSPDGITWTARTSQFGTDAIYNVTYGNELFVAVGENGGLSTSPDGVTWTTQTSQFGVNDIRDIIYNNIFVAVGLFGKISTSPDGENWTAQTSQFGISAILAITYDNGLFVAVGDDGKLSTSPDGETWTARTSQFDASTIQAIIGNGNLFVAVGGDGKLSTSPDGETWTARTSQFGTDIIYDIAYGNKLFVAVGIFGKISTSSNGTDWTAQTSRFDTTSILAVIYNSLFFMAAGLSGKLSTSPHGIAWTLQTTLIATAIRAIAYGGGIFVAAGDAGELLTSLAFR